MPAGRSRFAPPENPPGSRAAPAPGSSLCRLVGTPDRRCRLRTGRRAFSRLSIQDWHEIQLWRISGRSANSCYSTQATGYAGQCAILIVAVPCPRRRRVPVIEELFLNSVFYLYPSVSDAERDRKSVV